MPQFRGVRAVFDATSADAHRTSWTKLVVNLDEHLHASNLNMVT